MADPLQTQMTRLFICRLHRFSMQALYFMSDAISQHWLLKSTFLRIRCLCSWKRIDGWLLFTCPALTPTTSEVQNNKHLPLAVSCFFWSLIVQLTQVALILTITYYRNSQSLFSVSFQILTREKWFTLTRLPTEGWISGRSWQPSLWCLPLRQCTSEAEWFPERQMERQKSHVGRQPTCARGTLRFPAGSFKC